MKRRGLKLHYNTRCVRAAAVWVPARLKRRKTKLKFSTENTTSTRSFIAEIRQRSTNNFCSSLKQTCKYNLPYVWEDYVDIMSEKRNKVGNNESARGPDDQKRWQKAESLHEPKHLGEILRGAARQRRHT